MAGKHRKDGGGCSVAVPYALLMLPWAMFRLARDTRREQRAER